jgi:hypothetical protein
MTFAALLATLDSVSITTFVRAVLALSLASFLAHSFYEWYRLSHIPGPFWASLSKFWMLRQSLKGRMHSALKDVTDKYGQFPTTTVMYGRIGTDCSHLQQGRWQELVQMTS